MTPLNIKSDDGVYPEDYDASPCIYLSDDQVEALGIKGMPAPGTVFMLRCRAVVQRVTAEAEEAEEVAAGGNAPDVSLELRITDMEATTATSRDAAAAAQYPKG